MGIGDDRLHALQSTPDQGLEEARPERLRFGRPDLQADDLAPTVGADGDGDYRRDRDDAPALALFEVGCVEPKIEPIAFQRPLQEGADPLIDILAELGDLGF